MSEPFRPYEKLVDIKVFGKTFQVPERNSLLRCFQFISPETIRDAELQVHRDAWDGDHRNEPGAEMVPAREAAFGHAGHFLSMQSMGSQ
jgi:hypothetical protein